MSRYKHMTEEIFERACELIEEGLSVRQIFQREDFPARSAFFRWLENHPEHRDRYARACEVRQDDLFDEIIEISNSPKWGEVRKLDGDGNVVEIKEVDMIEHRRLQIEARKWSLGKLNPKKYGDKLDLTSGGDKLKGIAVSFVDGGRGRDDE